MTETKTAHVFETMVKPTHPEIIAALTNWKPPKGAYILLEQPVLHIVSEGERRWGMGLVTYNAESRAEVMGWVENSLGKGGRVLHYGNFPSLQDRRPSRVEKAMLYGGSKGANPWDTLARNLDTKMAADTGLQATIEEQKSEIDALRAKLAALESVKAEKKERVKKNEKLETEESNGSLYPKE
ncbi:MAG: hypothetical protein E6R03_09655 [Hyphomicrobiaceae bacterium]|nr:MAG: hypothetical protein E6R03_09655 [Hyphomicrobiaceae bacterium]